MQPWEQYLPAGASPASKAYAKLMWERGVRPQKVGSKWVWDPGPDPVHNPPGLGAAQGGTVGLIAGGGPQFGGASGGHALPTASPHPSVAAVAAPAAPSPAAPAPAAPTSVQDLISGDTAYQQSKFTAAGTIADLVRRYGIDPTPYLDVAVDPSGTTVRQLLGSNTQGIQDAAREGQQNPQSVLAILRGATRHNQSAIGSNAAQRGASFSSAFANTGQRENEAYAAHVGNAGTNFADLVRQAISGVTTAGTEAFSRLSANPPTLAGQVAGISPPPGVSSPGLGSIATDGERHGLDSLRPAPGTYTPPKPKKIKPLGASTGARIGAR